MCPKAIESVGSSAEALGNENQSRTNSSSSCSLFIKNSSSMSYSNSQLMTLNSEDDLLNITPLPNSLSLESAEIFVFPNCSESHLPSRSLHRHCHSPRDNGSNDNFHISSPEFDPLNLESTRLMVATAAMNNSASSPPPSAEYLKVTMVDNEESTKPSLSNLTSPQPISPRFSITTIESAQPPLNDVSQPPDPIPVIYHRASFVASPQSTIVNQSGLNITAPVYPSSMLQTSPPSPPIAQSTVPIAVTSLTEPITEPMTMMNIQEDDDTHPLPRKADPERVVEYGGPNNRYAKLNVILGKGAYKVVWKALDREEGIEVAWNCLQATKHEFNEFSQEIEILKRVRHPNIINFHDSWYKDGEFVFISELMTSGTLREYIHKLQNPSVKIIKRWARQILKGLLYLHSHAPPILHRDIKCDNIFINGSQGEVKIGDMGTAKMKFGKKYTVIGTPEFMAPEMYDEKGYSEKVDIYAFGMCVLEMVTGMYPYSECKNPAQIYKKVSSGIKPECLSKVEDPEILGLINCCIATENERWPARKLVEHPFFTDDPEVTLVSSTPKENIITFQIAFRGGVDRHAIKFDYHLDKDTIEDVVQEMIDEQVLSIRFKPYVVGELQKTLRDFSRYKHSVPIIDPDTHCAHCKAGTCSRDSSNSQLEQVQVVAEPRKPRAITHIHDVDAARATVSFPDSVLQSRRSSEAPQSFEYSDDYSISGFVTDIARQLGRDPDKAIEWMEKLHPQDILTVGDLRALHEDDWNQLGLTVFAARAFKNALHAKSKMIIQPKGGSLEQVTTNNSSIVTSPNPTLVSVPTSIQVTSTVPPFITSPRTEGSNR